MIILFNKIIDIVIYTPTKPMHMVRKYYMERKNYNKKYTSKECKIYFQQYFLILDTLDGMQVEWINYAFSIFLFAKNNILLSFDGAQTYKAQRL